MVVGRTLEHQMLDRLVGAVAVRADGRVPGCQLVMAVSIIDSQLSYVVEDSYLHVTGGKTSEPVVFVECILV